MLATLKNLLRLNPTKGFPPSTVGSLVLGCEQGQLNGVPLGSPLDLFMSLGPARHADWYQSNGVTLSFPQLGLRISWANGEVYDFEIQFANVPENPHSMLPAQCRLQARGQELELTPSTSYEEIAAALGAADDTARLVGRPTLEYFPIGTSSLLLEFDPISKNLLQLTLTQYEPPESAA